MDNAFNDQNTVTPEIKSTNHHTEMTQRIQIEMPIPINLKPNLPIPLPNKKLTKKQKQKNMAITKHLYSTRKQLKIGKKYYLNKIMSIQLL